MTKTFKLSQIKNAFTPREAIQAVEKGFKLFAAGKAIVAPLSHLAIEDKGISKVKYGYVKGGKFCVMKIASFFPHNKKIGIPAIHACMILLDQMNGEMAAILLDEAYLTNARTAAAGAIAAKYFAPGKIKAIGIVGAGVQAHMQLEYIRQVMKFDQVFVWARDAKEAAAYQKDMKKKGFKVKVAKNLDELGQESNVIVATTPATEPVVLKSHVMPGTLIISIGSDTASKCEIDPQLLKISALIVADSKDQCSQLGNIARAVGLGVIKEDSVHELGKKMKRRITGPDEIATVHLTGVAVQDVQIAELVYKKLTS